VSRLNLTFTDAQPCLFSALTLPQICMCLSKSRDVVCPMWKLRATMCFGSLSVIGNDGSDRRRPTAKFQPHLDEPHHSSTAKLESNRVFHYSIDRCLTTHDVKVVGSLCGGLYLLFPTQHHLRSCLYAYNGPLTRPTYRAVRHIVSIIDRVLVVALSSVVEGVGECRSTIELFSLLSQVYSQRKRGA